MDGLWEQRLSSSTRAGPEPLRPPRLSNSAPWPLVKL